jgi:predicted DNA-binding protein (MmcQ/YjbR family)
MDYEAFNKFCGTFKATSYVVQWSGSHVWKVGGKMFAIGGWKKDENPAFTFKTSESDFLFLSDEPGYRPAPYLANRGMKWIQLCDLTLTDEEKLIHFIKQSYRLVSLGLTKKKQKELGLNQS